MSEFGMRKENLFNTPKGWRQYGAIHSEFRI
jgi:hypothetical protein